MSEWNENASRDKSPIMSRSIVLVTYRGTTATAIVKYREFDPVARPFPRSITFVEILPLGIETRGIDLRLFNSYIIDNDYCGGRSITIIETSFACIDIV